MQIGEKSSCGNAAIRQLASQQAAERASDQSAANRTADRAADRFAAIGHPPADAFIGHRARAVSRDQLPGRQSAARYVGAENRGDDRAEMSQDAANAAVRAIGGCCIASETLLNDLISGFGIDRGVVF